MNTHAQDLPLEDRGSGFWAFQTMIVPVIIQVLFILGVIAMVGIGMIVLLRLHHTAEGIGIMLFGPLVARIYAEIAIVIFRINDSLADLRNLAIWAAERAYKDD